MPTEPLALHPPPPELTPTWTPDIWADQLLLMNACVKHGVRFQWSLGVLFIPLRDIEVVLTELADRIRVHGFDGFFLEGYRICPRLDYSSVGYGEGLTAAEAVAELAFWPKDKELWLEVVISMVGESGRYASGSAGSRS
jgi:hypothetical protein